MARGGSIHTFLFEEGTWKAEGEYCDAAGAKYVVSGENVIRLWDVASRRLERTFRGHTDHVHSVAFSHDGAMLASASKDRTVRVWSVATGEPIGEPMRGHGDRTHSVIFGADARRVFSGSWDGTVKAWDLETGAAYEPFSVGGEPVFDVTLSPDGTRLAVIARVGGWQEPEDPEEKERSRPVREISSLKYKFNGEGFVYDRRPHLFVVPVTGGEVRQITDGDYIDGDPAWSPDGTRLALATETTSGRTTSRAPP